MSEIARKDAVQSRPYAILKVGETASLSHTVDQRDFDLFSAAVSGLGHSALNLEVTDTDPAMLQLNWAAGFLSLLVGTRLPGLGSQILSQNLTFGLPPRDGDVITASITLKERNEAARSVTFQCSCTDQNNNAILTGTLEVLPPKIGLVPSEERVPRVRVERHERIRAIVARAQTDQPVATAVVMPVDEVSLNGALEAYNARLIRPILVGPTDVICAAAQRGNIDISNCRLFNSPDGASAAASAVEMARTGDVALIMKGDLHTDVLMHPVMASATGLRTARRISHVFVIDAPDYPRLLLVTDAAINIAPTLLDKVDIVQNAIHLAHILGIEVPKVAILSAVEMVNDRLQSTLDAAALCKMADRGQIKGGLLDGPLAFDNAISEAAAKEKGIVSPVAGQADILIVPDLEAGNMLAKQLTFLAGAEAAGVVVGARVPIILTSRADSAAARLASCAVAVLMARSGSGT